MARHIVASGNSRSRSGRSVHRAFDGRGSKIPANLERRCFEYDRKLVANVIDTLRRAINNGAVDIGMIADEQMFDDSISDDLARMAQRLDRMAARLNELLFEVGNADGYPKMAAGHPTTPAQVHQLSSRRA